MANEINNTLISGIKKAINKYLKTAPFDKTVEGTIVGIYTNNKYLVKINGIDYTVSSYGDTAYSIGNVIKIIYPQNNNDKMYILPKGVLGGSTYTLPVASNSLGGIKSGTDITVDTSGNVNVNDNSHAHIISNVTGLQTALDAKEPLITKSTAFNKNFSTIPTDIKMDGVQSLGVSDNIARADHIHPSDTSKLNVPTSGTLQPTIHGYTTAGTPTYVTQSGKYIKIGHIIFLYDIVLKISSKGGISGGLYMGGLPLPADGGGCIVFAGIDNMVSSVYGILGNIAAGTSSAALTCYRSTGANVWIVTDADVADSLSLYGGSGYYYTNS